MQSSESFQHKSIKHRFNSFLYLLIAPYAHGYAGHGYAGHGYAGSYFIHLHENLRKIT